MVGRCEPGEPGSDHACTHRDTLLAVVAPAPACETWPTIGDDFTITVRCTGCGEGRPVSQDPCPACGAPAYRHKTADTGEFWAMIDETQRLDRPGPGVVGDDDGPPFE
jgi:hypothetical protein